MTSLDDLLASDAPSVAVAYDWILRDIERALAAMSSRGPVEALATAEAEMKMMRATLMRLLGRD